GKPAALEFDANGERFVGEATIFAPAHNVRGALAVASSLSEALAPLRRLQRTIVVVTVAVMLLAVIAFRFVSELVARPVRQLVAGTQRVAKGDFSAAITSRRRDELGELAMSFNVMAEGLQQRDRIKDAVGKVLDPRVVER